jgi:hypothetical protein
VNIPNFVVNLECRVVKQETSRNWVGFPEATTTFNQQNCSFKASSSMLTTGASERGAASKSGR